MEFLTETLLETTTQVAVSTGTVTGENLLNPDVRYQYLSSGDASDLTITTITISFDATTAIDRIAIMENNWEQFNVFYNGATANAFTLTDPTTTSQWLSNTADNLYLAASSVNCTSVTFDIYTTQVANSEKAVGYIYVGAQQLDFERIPNAAGYTPTRNPREIVHKLSDGGTRRQYVQQKWSAKLKWKYLTESFRNSLETIYESNAPVVFVPFGTGTGWDGVLFEANWVGDFEFYKFSDEAEGAGFSGSIDLRET